MQPRPRLSWRTGPAVDAQALVNKHIFCVAARGGITCSSDKDKGKPTYQATVIPDGMAVTKGNKTLFLHRFR